ncbi:hypothetical protein BGZ81_005540 [Podila clonocystis]|nr:hypothetical protein BGZ81_005540 [Podila clonocystis]
MAVEECYICFESIHCITETAFEDNDSTPPSSSSSSPLSPSSSSSSSSPSSSSSSSSPSSSSSSSSLPLSTLSPGASKRWAVYGSPGRSTGKNIQSVAKIGTSLGCGKEHQYCLECLAKYVNTEVKARHWPVCCPSDRCMQQISVKLVEAVLGEGALEWHMLGVEHAISNKLYCPNEACNIMMERDSRNMTQTVNCPYCKEPFCTACSGKGHTGKTCAQVKTLAEAENEVALHCLAKEKKWSQCPKCKHMVDKISELLKVPETATADEIREAYKREALRTHPDRSTNIGGPDGEPPLSKEAATVLFQQVADAYYVLSNTERRREYDLARRSHSRTSWSTSAGPHAEAETVFGGVFEELLRPEVENPRSFYSPIGMASGAALGFICGGVPGALIGGFSGKQLGKIRDHKGVSVMEAFGRLEHAHKAAIIASLAAKIFSSLQ